MSSDPRVDAYIDQAAEFAQPMLRRLREQAHTICPGADEAIKWGMPALVWKGKNLCGFAGFKSHVAFFVQGERKEDGAVGMGEFGKMRTLADLPSKAELSRQLKARMAVIEAGAAVPRKAPKPPPEVPVDFAKALKASKPAAATFKALSAFNQRDYVTWITEAKQEATRAKRIAQAIEMLAEGKARNWKYTKAPKPEPMTYEKLRAFALSLGLPNVEDAVSWGQPNLKAHGKMWVWWSPHEDAPVFKVSFEEREILVEVDPQTFFFTDHYRNWPMVLVRPERLDLEWARANLIRTWRNQAKKTFLKKWDAEQAGSAG